jgi:hypothetical protein
MFSHLFSLSLFCVIMSVSMTDLMHRGSGDNEHTHEALDSSAASSSEHDVEASGGGGGMMSAFAGVFVKKSSEDAPAKKLKKKKKVTKYRTKLPLETEMDETRDMAIA